MSTAVANDERVVFLQEYKEIIANIGTVINRIESRAASDIVPELENVYMSMNNLISIAEFTNCKDLVELSSSLLKFNSLICQGKLEWEDKYLPFFSDSHAALLRIYDKFSDQTENTINESDVIQRLKSQLQDCTDQGEQAFDMDPEEKEVFMQELSDYVESFALGYDELNTGNYSEEIFFNCYKSAHTLKGFAAIIDFKPLHSLAFELEKLFSALRDKKITISQSIIDIVGESREFLFSMLDDILENQTTEYSLAHIIEFSV